MLLVLFLVLLSVTITRQLLRRFCLQTNSDRSVTVPPCGLKSIDFTHAATLHPSCNVDEARGVEKLNVTTVVGSIDPTLH